MTLRLPLKYFRMSAVFLNQTTIENYTHSFLQNEFIRVCLMELRKSIVSVCLKHESNYDEKPVTKQIPDSSAILFYSIYNGVDVPGYEGMVINQICQQIENKLFKNGKYPIARIGESLTKFRN